MARAQRSVYWVRHRPKDAVSNHLDSVEDVPFDIGIPFYGAYLLSALLATYLLEWPKPNLFGRKITC